MKLVEKYQGRQHPTLLSEGKLLEVTPVLLDVQGQPRILPPVIWPVDNYLLGYLDEHIVGQPFTHYGQNFSQVAIPGSMSNQVTRLSFIIRVLEAGAVPTPGTVIDPESVREIVAAIKDSDVAA